MEHSDDMKHNRVGGWLVALGTEAAMAEKRKSLSIGDGAGYSVLGTGSCTLSEGTRGQLWTLRCGAGSWHHRLSPRECSGPPWKLPTPIALAPSLIGSRSFLAGWGWCGGSCGVPVSCFYSKADDRVCP